MSKSDIEAQLRRDAQKLIELAPAALKALDGARERQRRRDFAKFVGYVGVILGLIGLLIFGL